MYSAVVRHSNGVQCYDENQNLKSYCPQGTRLDPNDAEHRRPQHLKSHQHSPQQLHCKQWLIVGQKFRMIMIIWALPLILFAAQTNWLAIFTVTVRKACPLWNSTQLSWASKRRRETRAWRHASSWNHVVNRVQLMSTALSFWCYFLLKFWFCEWASWNIVTSTLIFWPQNIYVTSLSRYITQNFGFLIQYVSICFVFN